TRSVFLVHLASGRTLKATGKHRVYGASGWTRVASLAAGDRLAIARTLPEPATPTNWPVLRLALLGHLIGHASFLCGQPLRYTTSSAENSRLVAHAAAREFGVKVTRHEGRGSWHQLTFRGNGNRWHAAGIGAWLRELGIWNQRSHEKRVPSEV